MSVAEEYAEYCTSLQYADIPPDVRSKAIRFLVDFFGNAIGGVRVDSAAPLQQAVEALDAQGNGATVLATGTSLSPKYAALLNGAFAHSLDFDDTHRAGSVHPGAPVISAALGAAEETGVAGTRLLTGIVAGYEVMTRLGMALNPGSHSARGFHATGTCGVFGATAAIGAIRGLSAAELRTAFGVNGSQAAGSLQFLENGSWNKRTHPGFVAHHAFVSSALATNGFHAASNPIQGERGFLRGYSDESQPPLATDGLGDVFELANTALKPYPCCRHMHTAIDGMLDLAGSNDIDPGAVREIDVRVSTPAFDITGNPARRYPETLVDAQFSLPFAMALSLAEERASAAAFLDAVSGEIDPCLQRLIDVTTVEPADWIDESYPDRWMAQVTVITDRDTFEATREIARGEPENPLDGSELREKFDGLVGPVLGGMADTVWDQVMDVESATTGALLEPIRQADRP